MISEYEISGKEYWVIGGAGYLGQSIIGYLLEAGANVLCIDLGDRPDQFKSTLSDSESLSIASLNVNNTADVEAFVDRQVSEVGVPDGLVNLTYGATPKSLDELSESDFIAANQTNLVATLFLSRSLGRHMVRVGKGSMVLFSSMYGVVVPDPTIYHEPMNVNPIEYGIGKAGVVQMTKYLAVHWAGQGVRVNCISPGPFPNPQAQEQHPEFLDRLCGKVPMGRIGKPRELAGAVHFLLSDASSYVTGQNLIVDGGWTLW